MKLKTLNEAIARLKIEIELASHFKQCNIDEVCSGCGACIYIASIEKKLWNAISRRDMLVAQRKEV